MKRVELNDGHFIEYFDTFEDGEVRWSNHLWWDDYRGLKKSN